MSAVIAVSTRGRPVSDDLAHVDAALEQWARWGKQGVPGAWPPLTILAKVIEQGFTGAAQSGPTPEMSDDVLAVERAVLRLRPIERRVLVKHYLHWQPVEVSAKFCGLNANHYRVLLNRARRHVSYYLEGFYYNNSGGIQLRSRS